MKPQAKWSLVRFLVTSAVLFSFWMLFTASFELFSVITGITGSVLIAALTYDVFIAQHQANLRYFFPRPFFLVLYFLLAIISLYISSAKMLSAVITGRVNPRIVHFRTRLRSDLARMVLANTITFTPGTITLDLNDDHLTVHWLFSTTTHGKAAGDAVKGRFERMLQKVLQ